MFRNSFSTVQYKDITKKRLSGLSFSIQFFAF